MPIGDVNSNEAGSGARYNDGKPPLDLIPVRVLREVWRTAPGQRGRGECSDLLYYLQQWQESCREDRPKAMSDILSLEIMYNNLDVCAQVFEYGKKKYAAWNWAKGMPWSVPLGCALRHIEAVYIREEINDTESGLPHLGHAVCNVVMLGHFQYNYPEGDDIPNFKQNVHNKFGPASEITWMPEDEHATLDDYMYLTKLRGSE